MASSEGDWETDCTASSDSIAFDFDAARDASIEPMPLRPVPSYAARPDDALCATCSSHGLTRESFLMQPANDDGPGGQEKKKPTTGDDDSEEPKPLYLGTVAALASKAGTCPLCRVVLEALGGADRVPTTEDGEATVVEATWMTDGPARNPDAPWAKTPLVRALWPSVRTTSGGRVTSVWLNLFPEVKLVANDAPTAEAAEYCVRPIREEGADFDMVKRWMALCRLHHGKACRKNPLLRELKRSAPAAEVPHFRVVDVEMNCLVKPGAGDRYAALSYVWGRGTFFRTLRSTVDFLEKPGALIEVRDQIPQTLQDAMEVTRRIGLRYLWVDSLCIVQDDESGDKVDEIKKMDLVYAAADIVIVAWSSKDAFAGLQGLRPEERGKPIPLVEMAPGFRLAYKTHWFYEIDNAPYYTRGWTYQETYFATRTLAFIDGKVTFKCQAVDKWYEHVFETEAEIKKTASFVLGRQRDSDDIGKFEGLIQNFSRRVLSYDSDIYQAFAGMARVVNVRARSDVVHGIPARFFDWFLLWDPLEHQARRPNAPSWSWAGWVGGSWPHVWDWYDRSMKQVEAALRRRTWIVWYQREDHDSTVCRRLEPRRDGGGEDGESAKDERNFYGGKVTSRFDLDCSRTAPTARTLSGELPRYTTDVLSRVPGSGFLQFWTVSILLRVDAPSSGASDGGPRQFSDKRRRLGLFGRSGRELGRVPLQADWLEAHGPLPLEREFVLLCEGRDERAVKGREDDEEGWRYRVMMLQSCGEYAERVAIASIAKQDVAEGLGDGACWKEIILG